MSSPGITKKANLLGQWHEDVFTDELVNKIAAFAAAEKGKKVKLKLSDSGLRITEPRGFLRSDESHFYPLSSVKTVTRNPGATRCVMFILADPHRKYQVIALRCESDPDAAHLVGYMGQVKKDQQAPNVSFRKRANGNWTLRDRSAHNANRHMAELFDQHGTQEPVSPTLIPTLPLNGDVHKQSPAPDTPRSNTSSVVRQGSYIKRNGGGKLTTTVVKINQDNENGEDNVDEDYVIETEVAAHDTQPVDVSVLKGRVHTLTNELNEIKSLLQQTDATDGTSTPSSPTTYPYTLPVSTKTEILPSRPQIMYTSSIQEQKQPVVVHTSSVKVQNQPVVYAHKEPVVYRAPPKTYEAKITTPSPGHNNPNLWATNRRVSNSYAQPMRLRADSFHSGKVTFDTQSIISNTSRKSKSLRLHSSSMSIPSTIERSIENTYARPVIYRRADSSRAFPDRPRRRSFHVTGNTKELKVFEYTGREYGDVAL